MHGDGDLGVLDARAESCSIKFLLHALFFPP